MITIAEIARHAVAEFRLHRVFTDAPLRTIVRRFDFYLHSDEDYLRDVRNAIATFG